MSAPSTFEPGERRAPAAEAATGSPTTNSGLESPLASHDSHSNDAASNTAESKGEESPLTLRIPTQAYASEVAQIRDEKPKRTTASNMQSRPMQVPPLVFPTPTSFEERSAIGPVPGQNNANGNFYAHNTEASNATIGSPQQFWDPNSDASYVPACPTPSSSRPLSALSLDPFHLSAYHPSRGLQSSHAAWKIPGIVFFSSPTFFSFSSPFFCSFFFSLRPACRPSSSRSSALFLVSSLPPASRTLIAHLETR